MMPVNREHVVSISVVRDHAMYGKCLGQNAFCAEVQKIVYDNAAENLPIPVRYNRFLNAWDFTNEVWFMFCHEDFEPLEDVTEILPRLDKEALYGPVGSKRVGFLGFGFQRILGSLQECKRSDDGNRWMVGRPVPTGTHIETVDCCCLLVHSSLVKRCGLRFDEKLLYDLYVEDFCASAKVNHGVQTRIVAIKACHHSGSRPTDRLYRHLPYLEVKYPNERFSATCTYFGHPSWSFRMQEMFRAKIGI